MSRQTQFRDVFNTYYTNEEEDDDDYEARSRRARSRQIRECQTKADMLKKLRELVEKYGDKSTRVADNTQRKKPAGDYTLKSVRCLLQKDLPPKNSNAAKFEESKYEIDTEHTATVVKRTVPCTGKSCKKSEIYDVQVEKTDKNELSAESYTSTIYESRSFQDTHKLMMNLPESRVSTSAASSDSDDSDEEREEDAVKAKGSYEISRAAGVHDIPVSTVQYDDLNSEVAAAKEPSSNGQEETNKNRCDAFISLLIRGDFPPLKFVDKNFEPLEPHLLTKWSFVNSAMIYGVDCIATEPAEISIILEQWINLSTLIYGVFGSYLSLSILVVGLTKLDDRRVTILGLANCWLLKKYRDRMESDPVCKYRNINFGKIEDVQVKELIINSCVVKLTLRIEQALP